MSSVPTTLLTLAVAVLIAAVMPQNAGALGEASRFDVRGLEYGGGNPHPRESAPRRLAWEIRKRTSVDSALEPTTTRLDDAALFDVPFLYWTGDAAFDAFSDAESTGLARFVAFGGFVLIDDASASGSSDFDASVRRELSRALPDHPLASTPNDHVLFRSFYLLDRPEGRVRGPDHVESITVGERLAVLYSRHDLGGALARDNLGNWEHSVVPDGETQRERAIRFAVNIVMYALCLDYKDDQVHAPFIMRRRGG